jgi:copper(I)-binding protein
MRLLVAVCLVLVASALGIRASFVGESQPTVRASEAWIQAPAAGSTEANAFIAIDNGTMYDVFIVGVQSDVATVELRDRPQGATAPEAVKEVPVPAFGRLEMSPDGVHLHLTALKKPLVVGDVLPLVVYTDGGEQITVTATVK